MKKIIPLLVAATVILGACSTGALEGLNENQISLLTPETQNEEKASILPEGYEGVTEFVAENQTILSINDAINILELYPGNPEDGTPTSFLVEYDVAWFRETSGLSFNSIESPTFFDIPNREYKGYELDTQKMHYHYVKKGDTYKSYKVKEAKSAFESISGYNVWKEITFEGDITLRGTLIYLWEDMINFIPFAQGNEFVPILVNWYNISWSDDYAQIEDSGFFLNVSETFLEDSVIDMVRENKSLNVELNITEFTLMFNDFSSSISTCKIKSLKVI